MTRLFPCRVDAKKREAMPPFFIGAGKGYFAVGMTNSAPLPIASGQRCITLL